MRNNATSLERVGGWLIRGLSVMSPPGWVNTLHKLTILLGGGISAAKAVWAPVGYFCAAISVYLANFAR